MKTCQDTASLLTEYIEEQLPPDDASALKTHIEGCPACEAFVISFKTATEATRHALMRQIPRDFDSRLQDFLKQRIAKG